MKRLYKSRTESMIFGVCGGIAKYFDVDVAIVRLVFVLGLLVGGWGLPVYIVAAIVSPEEPKYSSGDANGHPQVPASSQAPDSQDTRSTDARPQDAGSTESPEINRCNCRATGPQLFGYILILIGAFFLVRQFMPSWLWSRLWWLRGDRLWPLILVAIGVAMLARRSQR